MLRFWDPRELRERPWLAAALICAALLALPAFAWLLAPHVGGFTAPAAPRPVFAAREDAPRPVADDAPSPVRSAPPLPSALEADDETPGIVGKVVDPNGEPAKDASIVCNEPTPLSFFASTNAEGRFKMPLGADGCKVIARQDAYSASDETRLDNGRPNELRLKAPGGIEGVVVDEQGAGVTPVLVAIESFAAVPAGADAGGLVNHAAKSFDARSGAFSLEKLAAGRYTLTVSADARPPVTSDPIDIEAGHVQRGVRLVLAKGGKVSGHVVDSRTKRPIFGAVVSLDVPVSGRANGIKGATTDDRGAFVLEGVPPGAFSIRVAHAEYATKIVPSSSGDVPAEVELEHMLPADGGGLASAGIGASLVNSDDGPLVFFMNPTGPAAIAGVRAHELILKIDGVDAKDMSTEECARRLRGEPGTTVVLTIKRDGAMENVAIARSDAAH